MKTGKVKAYTPESQTHMIPEVYKTPKRDVIVERTSTHKYNTISSTNRVNHVTTFKNAPKMFQVEATERIKTQIFTDYFDRIDLKEDKITV